jgi:hypothetical protein
MSSRNLPTRRSSLLRALGTDRAAGKALATIQTTGFLERASDELIRDLALARISDIGIATRHGLDEGHEIVRDLIAHIEADPMGAKALAGIAKTGMRGLELELRRLIEGR